MIREKKYRKRRTKRKYRLRGHGFGSTLKNFASLWYHGLGAKWEEKKLCYGKTCCTKKGDATQWQNFSCVTQKN